MERVSTDVRPSATKVRSALLGALGQVGQNVAAERIGIDPSWISEMKREDLDRFCALIAAADLRLVPKALKLYAPERITAILELARLGLDRAAEPSEFGDNL